MNYILILGNSYRSCKAKFNSIDKQSNVKYTFATKIKHIKGIPFVDYIKADDFNDNPNAKDILNEINEVGKADFVEPPKKDKQQLEIPFNQPEENVNIPVNDSENAEQTPDPEEDILSEEESIEINDTEQDSLHFNDLDYEVDEAENNTIEETNNSDYLDQYNINEDEKEVTNESDITNPNVGEDVEEQAITAEDIKPVGDTPRGWHARKEFIDEDGNIFYKGTYVGNVKDNNIEE